MDKVNPTEIFVEEATEHDSDKLKLFLAENSLPGLLRLSIERQSSFFNKYRIFSDDFTTYKMVDSDGNISGMASLVFQETILDGKRQNIAFALDLRIQRKQNALRCWEENFLPILEKQKEIRDCKHVFSSVANSHIPAYNAFIRPRSLRRNFPRYHMFRRFQLVSLHGLYPWALEPLTTLSIESLSGDQTDELQSFISKHQKDRPFYFPEKCENLDKIFSRWPGMGIDNFIIARDNQKNIVGCCALWDPSSVEKYKILKKSKRVITFQNTLKALSYLGVTRPLISQKSKYLNFRQLNFIYADNPDIFYSLLHHSYSLLDKNTFLTYLHFENQMNYMAPKSFISYAMPYGLYSMISPKEPPPGFIKPSFMENTPDIELAYI